MPYLQVGGVPKCVSGIDHKIFDRGFAEYKSKSSLDFVVEYHEVALPCSYEDVASAERAKQWLIGNGFGDREIVVVDGDCPAYSQNLAEDAERREAEE